VESVAPKIQGMHGVEVRNPRNLCASVSEERGHGGCVCVGSQMFCASVGKERREGEGSGSHLLTDIH
jgi:hypothetical protein